MNLVDFWERIFYYLSRISVFYWVRKWMPYKKLKITAYQFVEWWVMIHFLLSLALPAVLYFGNLSSGMRFSIAFYGFLRVFEIIVYQINVLLFDPYRAEKEGEEYKLKSIRRMVVLLLQNYVEMMFWFSTMVIVTFSGALQIPYMTLIQKNILCIITLDPGIISELDPGHSLLFQIAFIEVIAGLIMTLISLARFIGILPPVEEIESI